MVLQTYMEVDTLVSISIWIFNICQVGKLDNSHRECYNNQSYLREFNIPLATPHIIRFWPFLGFSGVCRP